MNTDFALRFLDDLYAFRCAFKRADEETTRFCFTIVQSILLARVIHGEDSSRVFESGVLDGLQQLSDPLYSMVNFILTYHEIPVDVVFSVQCSEEIDYENRVGMIKEMRVLMKSSLSESKALVDCIRWNPHIEFKIIGKFRGRYYNPRHFTYTYDDVKSYFESQEAMIQALTTLASCGMSIKPVGKLDHDDI